MSKSPVQNSKAAPGRTEETLYIEASGDKGFGGERGWGRTHWAVVGSLALQKEFRKQVMTDSHIV